MGGRSAAALAAALWLGVLAGRSAGEGGAAVAALVALALAALAVRAPRLLAAALLVAAAFATGASRGAVAHAAHLRRVAACGAGALHRVTGTVSAPALLAGGRATILLRVERAEPLLAAGTCVRLRLPEGIAADWGDRVALLAEFAPARPARNPGGGDGRASGEAAGVAANGRAFAARPGARGPAGAVLAATVVAWRRAIERTLELHLGPEARALVVPLVTGDRGALPPELDADFRAAGLVHLLALSGLHLTALAAVARVVAASLGGGVTARAVAGMLAALFYLGLAGPIPSLARAAVSEIWVALARITRREADAIQALAVTVLLLLALRPEWALDLGFQLSCAATLGLAAFVTVVPRVPGPLRGIALSAGATLAAQWTCAPILLARTFGLSWPALFANLVAVPTCGLLLAAAWFGIVADAVASGAGHFFFSACELLSRALVAETTTAARWPLALAPAGHSAALVALAAAGAGAMAAAAAGPADLESGGRRWPPGREALLLFGALLSAIAIAGALTTPPMRPPPGSAWIVVLDVGQGDAIALGLGDGWWLVDTGPRSPASDAGDRVVRPFLRWAAVRRLEALALTHDDGDHTGGLGAVRAAIGVPRVLGPPPRPGAPGPLARVPPRLRVPAARGETLHAEPAIVALWPPRDADPLAQRGDNAGGLVLEIAAGGHRALLLADVDSLVEDVLQPGGRVELVKAGHHGSASSSGCAFLARVRPRIAAISAGERNVYGHPAAAALARLAAAGARIDRTDREGALWYELGASGLRRIDWREGSAAFGEARGRGARPAPAAPVAAPRAR